ncbi:hypothetical protein ANN_11345 [Periplaneta americana]|uniref:Uncharacterized protein n=1 Tax=Periplaneta americana TaxID=6978 RepID=A0ABQ8T4R8_PERAM|nr:hypothetical protein ANN_11345 [Periplaneta americana]
MIDDDDDDDDDDETESVIFGDLRGKRPLEKPRVEDNIKMDMKELGYDARDWINLAQDRDQWRASEFSKSHFRSNKRTGSRLVEVGGTPSRHPTSKPTRRRSPVSSIKPRAEKSLDKSPGSAVFTPPRLRTWPPHLSF